MRPGRLSRWRALGCLLLVAVLPLAGPAPGRGQTVPAQAGRRVALVVGNSGYLAVAPLANPANDARLIAATLRGLGFTIVGGGPQLDLDREHFADAVRRFGAALAGAQIGLFYYAGHGLQVDGVNWLVPVDANPARKQDLDFQMIDADLVLRQMDGAGTKLNIVVLDACRNNPFGGRGLRGLQNGLAQMSAPDNTIISYATQPGNVAADGGGADSPYSLALSRALQRPELEVLRMFNNVGLEVKRSTGNTQQPWIASSPVDGEFYLAAASQASPAPSLPLPAPQVTAKPVPPLPAATNAREQAASVVSRYYSTWSAGDPQAMQFLRDTLGPTLEFYGGAKSREQVLSLKQAFLLRWPSRRYMVRPGTLTIGCDPDGTTCDAAGLVDWECRSEARDAHASGTAEFRLRVRISANGPMIVGETDRDTSARGR